MLANDDVCRAGSNGLAVQCRILIDVGHRGEAVWKMATWLRSYCASTQALLENSFCTTLPLEKLCLFMCVVFHSTSWALGYAI